MIWARYFPREGFSLIVIGLVTSTVTHMCSAPAVAHDQWSDGSPIPAWVSNYCCGVADAHRLREHVKSDAASNRTLIAPERQKTQKVVTELAFGAIGGWHILLL